MNLVTDAACIGQPDYIFFERRNVRIARSFCAACPVTLACLSIALEAESESGSQSWRWGVFGGLTPAERQRLVNA